MLRQEPTQRAHLAQTLVAKSRISSRLRNWPMGLCGESCRSAPSRSPHAAFRLSRPSSNPVALPVCSCAGSHCGCRPSAPATSPALAKARVPAMQVCRRYRQRGPGKGSWLAGTCEPDRSPSRRQCGWRPDDTGRVVVLCARRDHAGVRTDRRIAR